MSIEKINLEYMDELDDLKFLNELLSLELDNLKQRKTYILKYREVQHYQNLLDQLQKLNKDNIELTNIKQRKDDLYLKYEEVQKYQELVDAIKVYTEYKNKILTFKTNKEGRIYNQKGSKIKLYSLENLITFYLSVKKTTIVKKKDLQNYRKIALKKLQGPKSYPDDEIIEEFLGVEVYQNPENYQIEPINQKTLKNISTYQYDNLNEIISSNSIPIISSPLTEREEEAFKKTISPTKEKQKIKKIGE